MKEHRAVNWGEMGKLVTSHDKRKFLQLNGQPSNCENSMSYFYLQGCSPRVSCHRIKTSRVSGGGASVCKVQLCWAAQESRSVGHLCKSEHKVWVPKGSALQHPSSIPRGRWMKGMRQLHPRTQEILPMVEARESGIFAGRGGMQLGARQSPSAVTQLQMSVSFERISGVQDQGCINSMVP